MTSRFVLTVALLCLAGGAALWLWSPGQPPPSQLREIPPPAWTRRLAPEARSGRPNVLLVVYDARRRDDFSMGPFGNGRNDTPFLARFGQDAVSFEDAVAPGCWTIPVHAVMFSGLSVCQLGIDRYNPGFASFGTEFLSLAEVLRLAGYRTIAYADHPFFYTESLQHSLVRGFELFNVINDFQSFGSHTNIATARGAVEHHYRLGGMPPLSRDELDAAILRFNAGATPSVPSSELDRDPQTGVLFPRLGPLFDVSAYFRKRYQTEFDEHVFPRGAAQDQPYFLFVNLHMCAVAEPDPGLFQRWFFEVLIANAREKGIALPEAARQESVAAALERSYGKLELPWGPFQRPYHYLKQVFDNRFYDATFEAVWRYLSERGLTRNTVTIATSDHGMSFGEHGERAFLHDGARPYEYITRVPLLIRFPEGDGLAELHGRYAQRVSLVDVFTTVLDLVLGPGVFERSQPIEGRSLVQRIRRREFEDVLLSESSLLPVGFDEWSDVAGYAKAVYWRNYKLILAPASYRRNGGDVWPDGVRLGEPWTLRPPRPAYTRLERPLEFLHDLSTDPHETRNLAEEQSETVDKIRALLGAQAWDCQPLQLGSQPVVWDEQARETLRALGYIQ